MYANVSAHPYQTLRESIADYSGYEEIANRKKTDHTIRSYFIGQIEKLMSLLNTLPKTDIPDDQLLLSDLTSRTLKMLTTICQSLKNPTYNESLFFVSPKLKQWVLENIYQFENTMYRELSDIILEIETLKDNQLAKEAIEDHFLHIKDFIDNFNQALFERESLLSGDEV